MHVYDFNPSYPILAPVCVRFPSHPIPVCVWDFHLSHPILVSKCVRGILILLILSWCLCGMRFPSPSSHSMMVYVIPIPFYPCVHVILIRLIPSQHLCVCDFHPSQPIPGSLCVISIPSHPIPSFVVLLPSHPGGISIPLILFYPPAAACTGANNGCACLPALSIPSASFPIPAFPTPQADPIPFLVRNSQHSVPLTGSGRPVQSPGVCGTATLQREPELSHAVYS